MENVTEAYPIASNDCIGANVSQPTLSGNQAEEWGIRWITATVSLIGVIANTAFLYVIYRHKSMRNTTNIYLASLAVADNTVLMIGGVGVAINSMSLVPSPAMACLFQTVIAMPFYASMSLVSLVTLDRFYAICSPLKHRAMKGKARNIKLSASAWVFGVIYAILSNSQSIILGTGCRMLQPGDKMINTAGLNIDCSDPGEDQEQFRVLPHDDVLKPLPFMTLLIVNIFLYARIIHCLRRSAQNSSKLNGQQNVKPGWVRNISKSRIRITRMLAVTTLVFFVSNLPRSATTVVRYIQDVLGTERFEFLDTGIVTILSSSLLLSNSCVNPLIYVLTNAKYKQAFREVFLSGLNRMDRDSQSGAVFHVQVPVSR